MKPSLRFLLVAVVGWAGVRAATLGSVPGAELFEIKSSEAMPPPITPTTFPPIEPVAATNQVDPSAFGAPSWRMPPGWPGAMQPMTIPVYIRPVYAPPTMQNAAYTPILPTPAPNFYSPAPVLDDAPMSRVAYASMPPTRPPVSIPVQGRPAIVPPQKLDRVQLTAWALLRGDQTGFGPSSLANTGNLGGSQAGARLSYNFTRQLAAALRLTSNVNRNDGEVAAGVRIMPLQSLPVWFTLERRQSLSQYSGRNAFALFAEGGVYQRQLPWEFSLDAYLQGGVVGFSRPEAFIDGGVSAVRPVYRQFSVGLGSWGGAQPGVYRVDVGPRVSMKLRQNMRVHLDWRQRLAGNAQPGSGPAITLAGDF